MTGEPAKEATIDPAIIRLIEEMNQAWDVVIESHRGARLLFGRSVGDALDAPFIGLGVVVTQIRDILNHGLPTPEGSSYLEQRILGLEAELHQQTLVSEELGRRLAEAQSEVGQMQLVNEALNASLLAAGNVIAIEAEPPKPRAPRTRTVPKVTGHKRTKSY